EPERLAGRYYSRAEIIHRLEQVGCRVQDSAPTAADPSQHPVRAGETGAFLVAPPSWRPDLTRAADLVEEIARLEGYDTIVPVLPVSPVGPGLSAYQRRRRRIADDLASAGLTEVKSFPFIGKRDLDALDVGPDDRR